MSVVIECPKDAVVDVLPCAGTDTPKIVAAIPRRKLWSDTTDDSDDETTASDYSTPTTGCLTPALTPAQAPNWSPISKAVAQESPTSPIKGMCNGTDSFGDNIEAKSPKVGASPSRERPTAVMLKNLPNQYTRDVLLQLLDTNGFKGQYDFVYLPIDFNSRLNLGYAFINLVSPSVADRFFIVLGGFSHWIIPSRKTSVVSWSGPKGLEELVEKYKNSPVMHESVEDKYKPIVLSNGVRTEFPEATKRLRDPKQRAPRKKTDGGSVSSGPSCSPPWSPAVSEMLPSPLCSPTGPQAMPSPGMKPSLMQLSLVELGDLDSNEPFRN